MQRNLSPFKYFSAKQNIPRGISKRQLELSLLTVTLTISKRASHSCWSNRMYCVEALGCLSVYIDTEVYVYMQVYSASAAGS